MKKFVAVLVIVVGLVSVSQTLGNATYDSLTGKYFYDMWTKQTINDWTKVGAAGYGSELTLSSTTEMAANTSTLPFPGVETSLVVETPATVAVSSGMWAGYQWSAPAGRKITQFYAAGLFNFDASTYELRLTDGDGNLLWTLPSGGWFAATTPVFAPVDAIRLILYQNQPWSVWAWGGNSLHAEGMVITTVIPEPATLSILAIGSTLFLRRKISSEK